VADIVDKATRSQMMAGIRGKNTKPEKAIRTALHSAGYRYRLHAPNLPGKPDLVFTKYKAVVLVHGCFWHRHLGCWWCTDPASNQDFWAAKFDQNIRRDAKNVADLERLGWRVAVVWECALRLCGPDEVSLRLGRWLDAGGQTLVLPEDGEVRRTRVLTSIAPE
jgi:DNA mismatch endonuclease, patch repair protein